jgi:sterol desaturase/sphingolipid hydroxylase (fatty acid hydroxylase superfamily)
MVSAGAEIPTSWLLILPFVNIFWLWKWSGGVEHVTRGKSGQAISFILVFVLGIIGMAIVQSAMNDAIDAGSSALAQQPAAS